MTTHKLAAFGVEQYCSLGDGGNTGNLIHSRVPGRIFQKLKEIKVSNDPAHVAKTKENFAKICYLGATTVHIDGRLPPRNRGDIGIEDGHKRRADFIEAMGLPVIPFGLGVHAGPDATVAEARLHPSTLRMLQVVRDHAPAIAVRGAFTADVLRRFGIHNVYVTGCQSAYLSTILNEPKSFTHRDFHNQYCFNLTESAVEARLLEFGLANNLDFISQDEYFSEIVAAGDTVSFLYSPHGRKYYRRGSSSKINQRFQSAIDRVVRTIHGGDGSVLSANTKLGLKFPRYLEALYESGRLTPRKYDAFLRAHFKKFYDPDAWVAWIKDHYDFAFGTRFHGNMAALQAGVPALWLVHDMRTRELCEHLQLPNMPIEAFDGVKTVQDLRDRCDFGPYLAAFPARLAEFVEYLRIHDLLDSVRPDIAARIDCWLSRRDDASAVAKAHT